MEFNLINQTSILVLLTLIILIFLSIISWYIIINKFIETKQQQRFYLYFIKNYTKDFDWPKNFESNLLHEFSNENPKNSKKFSAINHLCHNLINLKNILSKYQSHEAKKEILTLHLSQSLDEIKIYLDRGLTILASIGSCTPFIGLFGTVLGIYHALGNINNNNSAISLNAISGPIAESLIATAIGLFCAIPAIISYNFLVRSNRLLTQNLRHL